MNGANMDMNVLIDFESIVKYVAKYCNKVETPTKAFDAVLAQALRNQKEAGTDNVQSVLRTAFNRLIGRRDKCETECAHLILSSPYVYCSHQFEHVNITSSMRKINLGTDSNAPSTLSNWVDLYSSRLNCSNWKTSILYASVYNSLVNINFRDFIKMYIRVKGKLEKRKTSVKPLVIVFSPEVQSDPEKQKFWQYAYFTMLKLKPWTEYEESVVNLEKGCLSNFELVTKEVHAHIIDSFNDSFRNQYSLLNDTDNCLQRGIEFVANDRDLELDEGSQFSIQEFESFDQVMRTFQDQQSVPECTDICPQIEWNSLHDFKTLSNAFPLHETTTEFLNEQWQMITTHRPLIYSNPVHLADFHLADIGSKQQHDVIKVYLQIMGLWENPDGSFAEPRRQGLSGNVMLVPGPAGSGTVTMTFIILSIYFTCINC